MEVKSQQKVLVTTKNSFEEFDEPHKKPQSSVSIRTDTTEEDVDFKQVDDTKDQVRPNMNAASEIIDLTEYYDDEEEEKDVGQIVEDPISPKPLIKKESLEENDKEEEEEEEEEEPNQESKELFVDLAPPKSPTQQPDVETAFENTNETELREEDMTPVTKNRRKVNAKRTPKKQKKKSKNKVAAVNSSDSKKKTKELDEFKQRKLAKEERAQAIRDFLGEQGDTLIVEQKDDDSVSFVTLPKAIEDSATGSSLAKGPRPSDFINPMLAPMGSEDEEDDKGARYGLEALMSHRHKGHREESKWENVSETTDEVETVLGDKSHVSLQFDHGDYDEDGDAEFYIDEEMGMVDVDMEQSSVMPKEGSSSGKNSLRTSIQRLSSVQTKALSMVQTPESRQQLIQVSLASSIVCSLMIAMMVVIGIVFS